MENVKKQLGRFIGSSRQSSPGDEHSGNTQDTFGRFHTSTSSKPQSEPTSTVLGEDSRIADIRSKASRFRVLIIGRANAGKTTILQKVCNTGKQPEIFDTQGKKIRKSILRPTVQRGIHNIENELVFKSNPGFVFHDSRGFEAGGADELNNVKEFIAKRSRMTDLGSQLHVIWYCIPMDDERPFTAAERSFFSECGTGNVPVVAIFTKFDALEDVAYSKLTNEGIPHDDAIKQTADRAVADFKRDYLPVFDEVKYPPKGHLYLRDMNKPKADCRRLTETVAAVLDKTNLLQLFVSVQRNNLELCVKYAVKRDLMAAILNAEQPTITIPTDFQEEMVQWFPHFSRWSWSARAAVSAADSLAYALWMSPHDIGHPNIQSKIISLIAPCPASQHIATCGVLLAIILEHSFYWWDQVPSRDNEYLTSAIEAYQSSGNHARVTEAVDALFKEQEGQLFAHAMSSSIPDESFAEQLAQIAVENCLSPP